MFIQTEGCLQLPLSLNREEYDAVSSLYRLVHTLLEHVHYSTYMEWLVDVSSTLQQYIHHITMTLLTSNKQR